MSPFSPCKPGTHIQSLLSSPVLTEPVLAQASLGGEDLGGACNSSPSWANAGSSRAPDLLLLGRKDASASLKETDTDSRLKDDSQDSGSKGEK